MDKAEITIIIILVLILAGFAAFYLSGCTTIQYTTSAGEMFYQRIGGSQVDNFSVTKTAEGDILVEFDKYIGEGVGPIVAAAVKAAVEAAK